MAVCVCLYGDGTTAMIQALLPIGSEIHSWFVMSHQSVSQDIDLCDDLDTCREIRALTTLSTLAHWRHVRCACKVISLTELVLSPGQTLYETKPAHTHTHTHTRGVTALSASLASQIYSVFFHVKHTHTHAAPRPTPTSVALLCLGG